MPEFILNAGVEIPFILILLALLGFRQKVNPRARLLVKAPPEKVFALVDLHHGKVQTWSRTTVTSELIDRCPPDLPHDLCDHPFNRHPAKIPG